MQEDRHAIPMALQGRGAWFTPAMLRDSAELMLQEAVKRLRVAHEMEEEGVDALDVDSILRRMMSPD